MVAPLLLLLKFKWIFFFFSLYPSPEIKQVTGLSESYKIDLCIFLKKCFRTFITWILIVLLILYFGFLFYCMRLIVMVMIMCPWYYSKNLIYCVSNPCVFQGSWNLSRFMVEKLNQWLIQGQSCWSMQRILTRVFFCTTSKASHFSCGTQ